MKLPNGVKELKMKELTKGELQKLDNLLDNYRRMEKNRKKKRNIAELQEDIVQRIVEYEEPIVKK